jgi:hypothetical protein
MDGQTFGREGLADGVRDHSNSRADGVKCASEGITRHLDSLFDVRRGVGVGGNLFRKYPSPTRNLGSPLLFVTKMLQ